MSMKQVDKTIHYLNKIVISLHLSTENNFAYHLNYIFITIIKTTIATSTDHPLKKRHPPKKRTKKKTSPTNKKTPLHIL
jgi:hypothetical protein